MRGACREGLLAAPTPAGTASLRLVACGDTNCVSAGPATHREPELLCSLLLRRQLRCARLAQRSAAGPGVKSPLAGVAALFPSFFPRQEGLPGACVGGSGTQRWPLPSASAPLRPDGEGRLRESLCGSLGMCTAARSRLLGALRGSPHPAASTFGWRGQPAPRPPCLPSPSRARRGSGAAAQRAAPRSRPPAAELSFRRGARCRSPYLRYVWLSSTMPR